MNQEIKDKLEQAAETAWEQDQQTNPTPVNPYAYVYGFKAGAQTILENQHEWGLVRQGSFNKKELFKNAWKERSEKYRVALERIITPVHGEYLNIETVNWIAKEALKNNEG